MHPHSCIRLETKSPRDRKDFSESEPSAVQCQIYHENPRGLGRKESKALEQSLPAGSWGTPATLEEACEATVKPGECSENTWNLKLVNVQRVTKKHIWTEDSNLSLDETVENKHCPDLIRIPANSKTKVNAMEYDACKIQKEYCNTWLCDIGANRDLMPPLKQFKNTETPGDILTLPNKLRNHVNHTPDLLLADLVHTGTERGVTITVEDKDPSVLWRMTKNCVMNFWRSRMRMASDRWQIFGTPATNVLTAYHKLLNRIVPRNLMPGSNAFGINNVPYIYFTVKHKCFKASYQRKAGATIPPAPSSLSENPQAHFHRAHTCCNEGHSCLRNIVSFKKLPGRMSKNTIHI